MDANTLLKFRYLLKKNNLNKVFFDAINRVMVASEHIMKGGAIVDATIISAPSSTKKAEKKSDLEMHQTKKGNEWHFGMKCHAGVDAGTGFVHTIEVTPANTHDISWVALERKQALCAVCQREFVHAGTGWTLAQKTRSRISREYFALLGAQKT